MKTVEAIYVLASILAACVDATKAESIKVQNLDYYRDGRTGLCFVSHRLFTSYGFITNVPCTREVEFLISTNADSGTDMCANVTK